LIPPPFCGLANWHAQPHAIHGGANADDLDGRADQLEKMFGALHRPKELDRAMTLWPSAQNSAPPVQQQLDSIRWAA
jgi:hypothetical protein